MPSTPGIGPRTYWLVPRLLLTRRESATPQPTRARLLEALKSILSGLATRGHPFSATVDASWPPRRTVWCQQTAAMGATDERREARIAL